MIIRAEEVASCADHCKLTIRGTKLKNKDGMFGKSDPFFTLSRLREDEKWQQVFTWHDVVSSRLARINNSAEVSEVEG